MANQDALSIVRQVFDAWNAHDVKRVHASSRTTSFGSQTLSPRRLEAWRLTGKPWRCISMRFPISTSRLSKCSRVANYVVTRWHSTGTHKGELMGIPATNRRGEGLHGCTVHEVKDGKLQHDWVHWDALTLLRQLGVMPAAPGR